MMNKISLDILAILNRLFGSYSPKTVGNFDPTVLKPFVSPSTYDPYFSRKKQITLGNIKKESGLGNLAKSIGSSGLGFIKRNPLKTLGAGVAASGLAAGSGPITDRLGNYFAKNYIDESLMGQEGARDLFTQARNMSGSSPVWYKPWTYTDADKDSSWYNPSSWGSVFSTNPFKQRYLGRGGSKFIQDYTSKKLSDPDTLARLFPDRPSPGKGLMGAIGPLGFAGAGTSVAGLLSKNPYLGVLGLVMMLSQGLGQYSKAKNPETWIQAFAKPRNKAEAQKQRQSYSELSNLASLLGTQKTSSESSLLEKIAGIPLFSAGEDTYHPISQRTIDQDAYSLLKQHFPVSRARKTILEADNLRPADKYRLLNAFDKSTFKDTGSTGHGVSMIGKVLPSLAGAGLGYAGAALAAPVLGLTDKAKNRFGIGSAALGAIVNNKSLLDKLL